MPRSGGCSERQGAGDIGVPGAEVRDHGRRHELLRRLHLRGVPQHHRPVPRAARRRRVYDQRHQRRRRIHRLQHPAVLRAQRRPDRPVLADHDRRLHPADVGRPAAGPGRELAGGRTADHRRANRQGHPQPAAGRDAVPRGQGHRVRLGVRGARGAGPVRGAVRPAARRPGPGGDPARLQDRVRDAGGPGRHHAVAAGGGPAALPPAAGPGGRTSPGQCRRAAPGVLGLRGGSGAWPPRDSPTSR